MEQMGIRLFAELLGFQSWVPKWSLDLPLHPQFSRSSRAAPSSTQTLAV